MTTTVSQPKPKRKFRWGLWIFLLLLIGAGVAAYAWLTTNLRPMPEGPQRFIRWERPARIGAILADLQHRGVIRDANSARIYAWIKKVPTQVQTGTYEVAPGMTVDQILSELQKPIRQMVRIPETNWSKRTANLLEQKVVVKADEYMALVEQPEVFKEYVTFPLPKDSLEGYLYPDTYDLPPLLGAKEVIIRQLKNFEKRVWQGLDQPDDLHNVLIKASLVELEAGAHEERPTIAGVIENRIAKNMRLQIDASLLYGIQEWRRLTFDDYRNIDSPYNLYRVDGLPPGPICSPQVKSIEAVLSPEKHNHLYYVAIPGTGRHMFAPTYEEHRRNIQKRNRAVKEAEKQ